jgi:multidrug efflux pump subunit AcrA (membrane-fusion protein)
VTARFDRPEDVRILPGMTATLSVVLDAVVDSGLRGHFIPADAVFTDAAGAPNVWRVDPASQRVTRVPVTVGEVLDGQIAVQTGLSTGDLVVTGGVHLLEPDQQVRPLVQAAD